MSQDTPDEANATPDSGTDGQPSDATATQPRIEAALKQVRRECWKAATVQAAVEATVVFLAVNLALVVLDPSWLPTRFVLPETASDTLSDVLGVSGPVGLPGSGMLALAFGTLAFAGGVGIRVRRPLVEQFEAANPEVREVLRTARDAVDEGADTAMARRLYAEVLDRLGGSSGLALVDGRRLGVGVAAVVLLSVGTVQVAVIDLDLFDPTEDLTDGGGETVANNYTGLQDGDRVLGDSEAVEAGEEELNASIESSGGGRDVGEDRQFPSDGGPSAGAPSDDVEGQQAGFAAPEQVEDAELVREYNRRIRSEDATGGNDDGGESERDVDGDNA